MSEPKLTIPSRYERRIKVDPATGCWLWQTRIDRLGYARAQWPGDQKRTVGAHRLMYELLIGPIPDGLVIDHLCRVRNCVNPLHLEPVTQLVNTRRGNTVTAANAEKTHCLRGHLLAGENIRINKSGSRDCRLCQRVRNQARAEQIGRDELRRRWREKHAQRKSA